MSAPSTAPPPASRRRRLGWTIVIALVLAVVVPLAWMNFAFEQHVSPKPATERIMPTLEAEAATAFPDGGFTYRHDYFTTNMVVVRASIPISLPLSDADIDRLAPLAQRIRESAPEIEFEFD